VALILGKRPDRHRSDRPRLPECSACAGGRHGLRRRARRTTASSPATITPLGRSPGADRIRVFYRDQLPAGVEMIGTLGLGFEQSVETGGAEHRLGAYVLFGAQASGRHRPLERMGSSIRAMTKSLVPGLR